MNRHTIWKFVLIALTMLGTVTARAQIDYGVVADVHLVVLDASGNIIIEGGPWAYAPYSTFLLPDVPAGSDCTISVWTTDASGLPTYTGQIDHVKIMMEDPFLRTSTILVVPEPDRLALYYYIFGIELTGLIMEPLTETTLKVGIDIKPGVEENPFSLTSKGFFDVAIVGNEELDVNDIDPDSVALAGIPGTQYWQEDVTSAQPGTNADGIMDLVISFPSAAVIATLEGPIRGDIITLTLDGFLYDDTIISGDDTITIVGRPSKPPKPPKPPKKSKPLKIR